MAVTLPTVAEVRAIIATGLSDAGVQGAIDDAALMVEACVEPLDADRQTAIIKYTAADLISSTITSKGAGMLTSRKLGDAQDNWSGAGFTGKSAYWSRALMLDPNGCLARLGGRIASFEKV